MSKYDKALKLVFDKLGYTLGEMSEIITDPSQHKLIHAPAGGTKTTLSMVILALEKLDFLCKNLLDKERKQYLDTSEILCLVYNNHNVQDVKNVHRKIYNAFESLGLFSQDMRSEKYMVPSLTAKTVHAHAMDFVTRYKDILKLRSIKLGKPEFLDSLLKTSYMNVFNDGSGYSKSIKEFYGLYTNLILYDRDDNLDLFLFLTELDMESFEKYRSVFVKYDNAKKITQTQEFSDWIKYAIDLHKSNSSINLIERKRYKYIVADEIQDFTPIMLEYLKYVLSDESKTVIIGDPDQTIYQFNGADHRTFQRIPESTGLEFKLFSLDTNRRCAENTMSLARSLLSKMNDREDYTIKTVKKGGTFKVLKFETPTQENEQVLAEFDKTYFSTNSFLFRSGEDSIPFTRELYKSGRPFSLFNAKSFHHHQLYSGFLSTIKSVFVNKDRSTWRKLYKILPISKKALEDFLVLDASGNPTIDPECSIWSRLNWLKIKRNINSSDSWIWQIMFAQGLSENSNYASSRDVIDTLLKMYLKNYYNYLNADEEYFEYIKDIILEDFNTDNNLKWVIDHIEAKLFKSITKKTIANINVCTIHATKGLEFDRGFLMSMRENSRPFNSQSELRLYYVAATRQRSSLIMSIDSLNPHPFSTGEYTLNKLPELENRYDLGDTAKLDSLFLQTGNSNVRRLFT